MDEARVARGQDGLSLVEMLVAMMILGVVLAGVAMTTIQGLGLSRSNADRGVAANLASREMDTLRSLSFPDLLSLVGAPTTESHDVGDVPFDVTRRVYWSSNFAEPGACSGTVAAGDANVIRADVTVTWPNMRGVHPVRSETTIAPPIGAYNPNAGSLAVFVGDHQLPPAPVPYVQVSIRNLVTGVQDSTYTDADGCVVFEGLTSGDYEVSLGDDEDGYIDIDQQVAPTLVQGVQPGTRSSAEFIYTQQGELTVTQVVGRDGGVAPTSAIPWWFANGRGEFVGTTTGGSAVPVFPGPYQLYAGACPEADPRARTDADDPSSPRIWPEAVRPTQVDVAAGAGETTTVEVGSADVTWTTTTDTGRTVALRAEPVGDCDASLELGTLGSQVDRRYALPFGRWRVVAREGTEVVSTSEEFTVTPYPGDPVPTATLDLTPLCPVPPQVIGQSTAAVEAQGSNNVITIPHPPGVQANDRLLLHLAGALPSEWTIDGGGWTQLHSASSPGLAVHERLAGATSSTTIRVAGNHRDLVGVITAVRHVSAPVGPFATSTIWGTSRVFPSRQAAEPSVHLYAVTTAERRTSFAGGAGTGVVVTSPYPTGGPNQTVSRSLAVWAEPVEMGPTAARTISWATPNIAAQGYGLLLPGTCS